MASHPESQFTTYYFVYLLRLFISTFPGDSSSSPSLLLKCIEPRASHMLWKHSAVALSTAFPQRSRQGCDLSVCAAASWRSPFRVCLLRSTCVVAHRISSAPHTLCHGYAQFHPTRFWIFHFFILVFWEALICKEYWLIAKLKFFIH